jgi:hypothetical protein
MAGRVMAQSRDTGAEPNPLLDATARRGPCCAPISVTNVRSRSWSPPDEVS